MAAMTQQQAYGHILACKDPRIGPRLLALCRMEAEVRFHRLMHQLLGLPQP